MCRVVGSYCERLYWLNILLLCEFVSVDAHGHPSILWVSHLFHLPREPSYIPTPAAAPPPLSPRSDQSQASSQQGAKLPGNENVESIVKKVLVNLKQLLDSLTSWSQGKITEQAVSDVYVQLGNNVNACIVEFRKHGIDARQVLRCFRHLLTRCSPKNMSDSEIAQQQIR